MQHSHPIGFHWSVLTTVMRIDFSSFSTLSVLWAPLQIATNGEVRFISSIYISFTKRFFDKQKSKGAVYNWATHNTSKNSQSSFLATCTVQPWYCKRWFSGFNYHQLEYTKYSGFQIKAGKWQSFTGFHQSNVWVEVR